MLLGNLSRTGERERRDVTILKWLSVWWAEPRNAAVSVWFVFRWQGFHPVTMCSSYPRDCSWVTSAFRAAPRLHFKWSWLGWFLSLNSFQFVSMYHSQIKSKLKATNYMRKYFGTNTLVWLSQGSQGCFDWCNRVCALKLLLKTQPGQQRPPYLHTCLHNVTKFQVYFCPYVCNVLMFYGILKGKIISLPPY